MMWQLKPISKENVESALEKAQHYRLLNEPMEAESICLDILAVEPESQRALVTLILAQTDQFGKGRLPEEPLQHAKQLTSEYERAYYRGIIAERAARWQLRQGAPGARFEAFEFFSEAMEQFAAAEQLRPAGNDDALLRWNTCARYLERHPEVQPRPRETVEPILNE